MGKTVSVKGGTLDVIRLNALRERLELQLSLDEDGERRNGLAMD